MKMRSSAIRGPSNRKTSAQGGVTREPSGRPVGHVHLDDGDVADFPDGFDARGRRPGCRRRRPARPGDAGPVGLHRRVRRTRRPGRRRRTRRSRRRRRLHRARQAEHRLGGAGHLGAPRRGFVCRRSGIMVGGGYSTAGRGPLAATSASSRRRKAYVRSANRQPLAVGRSGRRRRRPLCWQAAAGGTARPRGQPPARGRLPVDGEEAVLGGLDKESSHAPMRPVKPSRIASRLWKSAPMGSAMEKWPSSVQRARRRRRGRRGSRRRRRGRDEASERPVVGAGDGRGGVGERGGHGHGGLAGRDRHASGARPGGRRRGRPWCRQKAAANREGLAYPTASATPATPHGRSRRRRAPSSIRSRPTKPSGSRGRGPERPAEVVDRLPADPGERGEREVGAEVAPDGAETRRSDAVGSPPAGAEAAPETVWRATGGRRRPASSPSA